MAQLYPLLPYVDFRSSDPPELPIRTAESTEGPRYVIRAKAKKRSWDEMILEGTTITEEKVDINVAIVSPGIYRVLLSRGKRDSGCIKLAQRISEKSGIATSEYATENIVREGSTAEADLLRAGNTWARVRLDPFKITFGDNRRGILLEQNSSERYVNRTLAVLPFGYSNKGKRTVAFHDCFTAQPDEHYYGLGEKFIEFDRRGRYLEMWHYNTLGVGTERAYKNIPFVLSSRGYGIFVDSVTSCRFDLAASNNSTITIVVPDSELDYYVILGENLKEIIARYSFLVGKPLLPPKWAFGLWISSGFQKDNTNDVIARARRIREEGIPCDVLHLDSYWQQEDEWSSLKWDGHSFEEPESMLKELRNEGYKISLWMNPYLTVGSKGFKEAESKGYLLKDGNGYNYVTKLFGAASRPDMAIIDLTNPNAVNWLKNLIRCLLEQGVDVMKTDFGEGVPRDAVAFSGMTGERLHNLYPLLYNDAVSEISAQVKKRSGIVWARSTYSGGQRHTAQWGGDPICTFGAMASTLNGGLGLSMCGHAFWSHDIGGFKGQPDNELYIRWAQFGFFSPLCRAHGTTSRLPWDFNEEALQVFRNYARLRYRLLPYIYSYAVEASRTGIPIMRPMVLEYPDDPCTYSIGLQYFLGAQIMVAPIYNRDAKRPVYFPSGRWIDFWNNTVIEGAGYVWVDAPLDTIPVYVRDNALIPTIDPPQYIGEGPFDEVVFQCYLTRGRGSFSLQDVDGSTTVQTHIDGSSLEIGVEGAKDRLTFRVVPLRGTEELDSVACNGCALDERCEQIQSFQENSGWNRDADGTVWVSVQRKR